MRGLVDMTEGGLEFPKPELTNPGEREGDDSDEKDAEDGELEPTEERERRTEVGRSFPNELRLVRREDEEGSEAKAKGWDSEKQQDPDVSF